jgi:hypothetical protein
MTTVLALVFWQAEVMATVPTQQNPEYGVEANSYLPIQRLPAAY